MKPNKSLPFAKEYDALGVSISLKRSTEGVIEVSNKASRVKALQATAKQWEESTT